jgi:hypothetical protein
MPHHLFTTTLDSDTGLPEDGVVNTWHFDGPGADPDNVGDMLHDFFNTVPTGQSVSLASRLSGDLLDGNMTIKGYDMSDPEPRAPVYEDTFTLTGLNTGDPFPPEVALCLSYQGANESGTPQSRRRGRVYIGPWASVADNVGRPSSTTQTILCAAARDLLDAANSALSWTWVQYSPTTTLTTPVVGGWVDNAWDSQRRRGWAPTSRILWSDALPA